MGKEEKKEDNEEEKSEESLNLNKERHSRRISRREIDNNSQKEISDLEIDHNRKAILAKRTKTVKLTSEKKIVPSIFDLRKFKSILRHSAVLIQIW